MQTVTTVGLDIAKSVFQVHGVDATGQVVIRRQLKRRQVLAFFQKLPSCLIGIEACASSHHWSRQLQALGHTVRLMPPVYVKPYVKRQKNDMADAEAICEAVTRTNMRFVPTKTPEQQSCLMLHRTRHLFIRQQTAVINSIRAHLAECLLVAGPLPSDLFLAAKHLLFAAIRRAATQMLENSRAREIVAVANSFCSDTRRARFSGFAKAIVRGARMSWRADRSRASAKVRCQGSRQLQQ